MIKGRTFGLGMIKIPFQSHSELDRELPIAENQNPIHASTELGFNLTRGSKYSTVI